MHLQQQERQEQSENRWLKLINQAREETKSTQKKLELLLAKREEEIRNLKQNYTLTQEKIYDKKMLLKIANDQIIQLEKKIKRLKENPVTIQSIFNSKKAKRMKTVKKTPSELTKLNP